MKPLLAFFLVLIISMPIVPFASGAVTSVDVDPEEPVQGDVVDLSITALPGEEVSVRLSFTTDLKVVGGEYELILDGVDVPQTPNSFTVKATGVKNLKVAVKVLFWITKSASADNGVATVSQGGVPAGQYEAKIYGDAEDGETSVTLTVTATTTVTMDGDGKYTLSYDTGAIPPGEFTAKIGGITKEITLAPSGGGEPVAVASFPDEVYVGEVVEFDGSGSYVDGGEIVDWDWEFGDGSTGSGSTVEHIYSEAGEYTVTLSVTDEFDESSSKSWSIVVVLPPNTPPVSRPGSSRVVFLGGVADFDGGASYDLDGEIVSYLWSFGDGSSASTVRASHSYAETGLYRVTLTVVDDDGAESSSGLIVTVVDLPVPTVSNYTARLGEGVAHLVTLGDSSMPLSVTLNATSPVSLTLLKYVSNPYPDAPIPLNGVPQFFDVSFSSLDAVDWPILVELDCSNLDLGEEEVGRLGLFYFDGDGWRLCQQTGVMAGGIVWALMSESEAAGSPIIVGEKPSGATFQISGFKIEPLEGYTGEYVNVSLIVTNIGSESGETELLLLIGGEVEGSETVSLGSGESGLVSYRFTRDTPGIYSVSLGGLSGDVVFTSPPKPAEIILTGLEVSPTNAVIGESIAISAGFSNVGELEGGTSVEVKVDGLIATSRIITLGGGESTVLRVSYTFTVAGQHSVTVGDESRVVYVVAENGGSVSENGSFTVVLVAAAALLVVLCVLGFVFFRRRSRHVSNP